MSRYSRPVKPTTQNTKYSQSQLQTISSVSKLLSHFIVAHQKNNIDYSWKRLHQHFKKKQRANTFMMNKLSNFEKRKNNYNLKWAFSHLISNKIHSQI